MKVTNLCLPFPNQIQWRFPERFGPDKYFCLFGSLHIEKSILALCGDMIKGSGLDAILSSCKLSIVGSEALVTVNHIKKARYCLQVSLCAIYSFLESAHQESGDTNSVWDWLRSRSEISEMCRYWHIIFQLMLNVLIFVRSIQEGNFALCFVITSYCKMVFRRSLPLCSVDCCSFT